MCCWWCLWSQAQSSAMGSTWTVSTPWCCSWRDAWNWWESQQSLNVTRTKISSFLVKTDSHCQNNLKESSLLLFFFCFLGWKDEREADTHPKSAYRKLQGPQRNTPIHQEACKSSQNNHKSFLLLIMFGLYSTSNKNSDLFLLLDPASSDRRITPTGGRLHREESPDPSHDSSGHGSQTLRCWPHLCPLQGKRYKQTLSLCTTKRGIYFAFILMWYNDIKWLKDISSFFIFFSSCLLFIYIKFISFTWILQFFLKFT